VQVQAKIESGRWVQLTLDGEEWGSIHRDLLPPNGVPATVSTREEIDLLIRKGALRYLGRLLSQQELLSSQLQSRLVHRGLSQNVAAELIAECVSSGFIDDQRWVEGYLRGQKRRLRGPAAISARLRSKGVTSSLVKEAVQEASAPEEQRAAIDLLLEGRLRGHSREKAYRALMRRGFDMEFILERLSCNRG
jgi:regulatory protein